ncbi:MAG TPA: MBL fold metallo-hydrolase [Gammaproteobacteria bacterium]|jgi:ribonuclease Z|nr:MBL fold metallo-hydrolase [Gammaproteobacteria bacterium]
MSYKQFIQGADVRVLRSSRYLRGFVLLAGLFLLIQNDSTLYAAEDHSDEFIKVTFLGTGTPVPNSRQFGQSILIEAGEEKILIDCGRGCAHRLWNIDHNLLRSTDHLFVTHLHSDHIVGIPDLYMNGWNLGRTKNLKVYGPEGVDVLMHHLRKAFEQDVVFRADIQNHKVTRESLEYISKQVSDGDKIQLGEVTVTVIKVDHHIISPAFGYRIDYKGYTVVISGDTTYSENLISKSQGVDLFIHEVMSPTQERFVRKHFEPAVADEIIALHTLAQDAGKVFQKTKPRMAAYTHLDNNPKFKDELLNDTAKVWDGPLVVAEDLMTITVGKSIQVLEPRSSVASPKSD